jgi:RNA polymerase sigma-70 factor (ECF subfamily)
LSDTQLFERLVLPHLDSGFALARRLMRSSEDGEDALQEALLRAHRHVAGCRPETARLWFLRILRNVCFDLLTARGQMRQDGFADHDPDDPDGSRFDRDVFGRAAEDPEAALIGKRQVERLEAAIAALPPLFREMVVLRDLEGLSYAEIAAVTGAKIGTVMSRLSRGRDLLMKELTERHG